MNSEEKIKLLIADDHAIVREGLITILKFQKDFIVAGEAKDGQEAVEKTRELKPDVVVMDLMMPVVDGAEATAGALQAHPSAKVLLLTTYGTSATLTRAFENGATGAVSKSLSKEELFDAIRKTAQGVRVVSPEIDRALRENNSRPTLSARQINILDSLTRGLTNEDIARQFGLTKAGVKFHLLTIFRKLDVSNRSEAVAVAIRRHLVADS